jgi:acyl-CoA thioesterase
MIDHDLPTAVIETPGTATGHVARHWWSWSGPHGGVVSALMLQTGATVAGEGREPRVLTVQLLDSTASEELEMDAQVVRDGGSSSVTLLALSAPGGPPLATGTLISARHRAASGRYDGVPAPDVPPPDACPRVALPVELVPFASHVEVRAATPARPLGGGETAELVAWLRLRAGGEYGPAELTVLADAMPPALYAVASAPVPVPTVELSVVFTDAPAASDWVLVRIASRTAHHGWCVDDCDIWSVSGELLAQSRQTRRVMGEF